MKNFLAGIGVILVILFVGAGVYFSVTPAGVATWNNWFYNVQKADDATNYETRKEVEDSCRAMVASYEADKLAYEQYKDREDKDGQSIAAQAKMRANRTATNYNNYVLKNSFVWEGNIPADILTELPIIE